MPRAWLKAVRLLALGVGALALAAAALVLSLPVLVDQPRVKAELQDRLSRLVRGSIRWDDLHLQLLPVPMGLASGLQVEIPETLLARAAQLEARLKLWPLLHGRVELASLTASDMQLRVTSASAGEANAPAPADRAAGPVARVRGAAGALAQALRQFAPEAQLEVQRGNLELRIGNLPVVRADAMEARAATAGTRVQIRLEAAGTHWQRLRFEADFDDVAHAGSARLEVESLEPQPWMERIALPGGLRLAVAPLTLRASLETDGPEALVGRMEAGTAAIRGALEARQFEVPAVAVKARVRADPTRARAELEELRVDGDKVIAGAIEYDYPARGLAARLAFDAEAERLFGLAQRVLGTDAAALREIEGADGRLRGDFHLTRASIGWRAGLQLRDTEIAIRVRKMPWPVRLHAGRADWEPGLLAIAALRGSLGKSNVEDLAARIRRGSEWRLEDASGRARLDAGELYPWLRAQPALAKPLREVEAVDGALDVALLKASGPVASPEFEARLVPHALRIRASALPAPLSVEGGTARLTRKHLALEQVRVALLDASASVSGTAESMGTKDFRVQVGISEGQAGPDLVGWAMRLASAPPALALRTPLQFTVRRLAWGPGRRLESSASVRFDPGVDAEADVAWQPGALDLRRLSVRAPQGSSTVSLRLAGRRVEGRFEGAMQGAVLAYFLKDAERFAGRVEGDLRFSADLDRLRHASAAGRLAGEGVELGWLVQRPLRVDKFSVQADHEVARIAELVLRSGRNAARMRGELRRAEQGPVVQAEVESDGLFLDELLAGGEAGEHAAAAASALPAMRPESAAAELEAQRWWPLPVTGRIAMRAGFLHYGQYRLSPLAGELVLEAERARLDVSDARLCGIAFPFTVEARRETWNASTRVTAPRQPVDEMARCLTGEHLQITGVADLAVELRTHGRGRELLRNLEGTGRFESRDGRMQKFELIGQILALLSIEDLATTAKDVAEGARGFRYRRIAAAGRLKGGQFTLAEGVFESPSASMAANGTVRLEDGETKMTVLVAPFGRVDRVVRGIPIVGYVIGGALTSIPVGVSGDIRKPVVVPLGPRAVTEELLGIFKRTVTLPEKLAEPPVSR